MKIAIVGASGMGAMTGGLLKEAGADGYFHDVNKEHIEKISQSGLLIEGIGGE